jgi:DNA repair protein RadC
VLQGDGSQLADYERLELPLCAFIPRRDVKPIAKELLVRFGSLSGALAAQPQRLMEIDGVGKTAAACLRASHLLLQRTAGEDVKGREGISNWAALLSYVKV